MQLAGTIATCTFLASSWAKIPWEHCPRNLSKMTKAGAHTSSLSSCRLFSMYGKEFFFPNIPS